MKWSVLTAQLRIRMVGTLYSSPLVKPLSKEPRNRIGTMSNIIGAIYPNQLILTNLYKPSFFTSFFFFSKRNRISVAFTESRSPSSPTFLIFLVGEPRPEVTVLQLCGRLEAVNLLGRFCLRFLDLSITCRPIS